MSSQAAAVQLALVYENYSWYSIVTILGVGLFGNFLHLALLSCLKIFRSNQHAFYLRAEALVNSCFLIWVFFSRYLPIAYGHDLSKTSPIWCKLRTCVGQSLRLLSSSLICCAAFDQFLTTSPHYRLRRLSTLALARVLCIISAILCAAHGVPFGISFVIDSSSNCVLSSIHLTHYYAFFYYPLLHGFLPMSFSALFSLLAYRNVRHLILRQISLNRRRLDRQLTAMIFIRVIFFIIFLLPYTIHRIYLLSSSPIPRSNLYQHILSQLIEIVMHSWLSLHYAVDTVEAKFSLNISTFLILDEHVSIFLFIGSLSSSDARIPL